MSADPSSALAGARNFMRLQQRQAGGLLVRPGDERVELAAALRAAHAYERSAEVEGDQVRVGAFRYDTATERERWHRTREVIERCAPGPHEDGNYLALLAREAATLEMYASEPDMNPDFADVLRRTVFGTTGRPGSHASTHLVVGRATVVLMSAGMMYFLYQAAKSVVLAWHAVDPPDGALTAFSSRTEDIRAVVDRDPTAADWLTGLLSAWLFDGIPRPPESSPPPLRYQPSLSLLTSTSERFILAHECVHAAVDLLRPPGFADAPVLTGWGKEFRADTWGAIMVVQSAARYDRFAPNMALQGPVLAMKAHELVDRALAFVRPAGARSSHPPFEQRLQAVFDAYAHLPGIAGHPDLRPEPALAAANTLELLWERVAGNLERRLRSGESLHPIWTNRM